MFRKVLLVSLVLFGLVFSGLAGECCAESYYVGGDPEKANQLYQYVTGMWPEDEIWPQMRVAMTNIADGNDTAAQAAVDKLRTDFSENQYLPVALHEVAKLYSQFKKYEDANELHQYVINHWPQHDYAMWSWKDVGKLNIELDDMEAVQAAIDKLFADFSENEAIAGAIFRIAEHCRDFKKYEKANQLYQHILATWPEDWHAMWSQMDIAKINIALGDNAAAEAATDKLLADFSKGEYIAVTVHEAAKLYAQLEKYEKAKQLHQRVVNEWPEHNYAMWSRRDLAKLNIILGNEAAAEAAIGSLIADFSNRPALHRAVFEIGEQYYNQAFEDEEQGRTAEAKDHFTKAIAVWERIIKELPESTDTALAYNFAAECYRRLGQYEKAIEYYQKVVDNWPGYEYAWNAQFLIGHNYEDLKKSGVISKSEADAKIKAAYEQVLEKYPACPAAKPARRWLSQQGGTK